MLIRLIYLSKALELQTNTLTESILRKSSVWNARNDITGVLCEGQGLFLQALEGESSKVTRLYERISADPHHKDLQLLHCESIAERRYGAWSMVCVRLSDVDPQTNVVWPEFDPYSASGQKILGRIDELIAQGEVVNPA